MQGTYHDLPQPVGMLLVHLCYGCAKSCRLPVYSDVFGSSDVCHTVLLLFTC
jgi:hypothetical protein